MNFILRPARPEDASVLEAIEQECFPDPSWDADEFMQYETTVAEFEGRIIGFIVTHEIFRGAKNQPPEYEILNLAVLSVFRGLGVAGGLLGRVIRPESHYYLEVRESNLPARNLYKKHGFVEIGHRPNYYDNPPEAAIVMGRK